MGGPERRSHDRKLVDYPVHVRTESGEEFDGVVDNLGILGALISTTDLEVTLDVGTRVILSIDTGGGSLAADGDVLRLEQEFAEGEIRLAFAVRFSRPITVPGE